MTKLLALSATALALALAAPASAAMPSPGLDLTATSGSGSKTSIEPAGYYQYRQFWNGNCFYRTLYVTDGNAWRYRYVYRCY